MTDWTFGNNTNPFSIDASPDDILSRDTNTGLGWGGIWDTIGTTTNSLFNSSLDLVSDYGLYKLQNELQDDLYGDLTTANDSSNMQPTNNPTVINSGISTQTLLIGGGLLAGTVILYAILS